MGGWYVCIIDMGRDERPVSLRWRCWTGLGETRSLLKSFSAVVDSANECEDGGGFEGDCGTVGDAGPGEGAADVDVDVVVVVLGCVEPPHCDMKERTAEERTERSISDVLFNYGGAGCLVKQHSRGVLGAAGRALPLLGRAMVNALSWRSAEASPSRT